MGTEDKKLRIKQPLGLPSHACTLAKTEEIAGGLA
jgi:hypothetical protein